MHMTNFYAYDIRLIVPTILSNESAGNAGWNFIQSKL